MLINLGRLLMLCVWAFLLLNIFQPDIYGADAWHAAGAAKKHHA